MIVCALADEAKHFSMAIENMSKQDTSETGAVFEVLQTGLGVDRINDKLKQSCRELPAVILVAGTAGSVNAEYNAGDIVIFRSAKDGSERSLPLSNDWTNKLNSALSRLHPKTGITFTSPDAVTSPQAKSALRAKYQVDCVDMETATIIKFANEQKIPVAAFRIIVDPHDQAIPPAALVGLREDGTTNLMATIFCLVKQPQHLLQILSLGSQYRQAMKTLSEAAKLLTNFKSNTCPPEALNYEPID